MTTRLKTGLAVLALAAATAFAQAPGAGQPGPARMQGRRGHMMGRRANFLGLTDAQRQQMKDIREQARTQAQPYLDQVKNVRSEIEKLVKSGAAPEQVQKRAEELTAQNGSAIEKLAGIRAWAAAKMYSVLTPEQRDKAQKLRESFGPGFGGGFGFMGMKDRPAGRARRSGANL